MIVYRKTVLYSTVYVSSMDIWTFIVPAFGVRNSSNKRHKCMISGSRSKVEKTMKNSILSNFDCDPEIILKWLQHYGNLRWISPQKTLWSTFFSTKKKVPSDIPKCSFSDFENKPEAPFGNQQFFFLKFNLLIEFFGVKYLFGVFRDHGQTSKKLWKLWFFRLLSVIPE